ncbi:MAG TPA: hypothetical protein VM901_07935 [Bdellovibrionota bacterium]|jgi:hypothetical protein|nr:hypothetical protein [Bdellovibrionota bacterium]
MIVLRTQQRLLFVALLATPMAGFAQTPAPALAKGRQVLKFNLSSVDCSLEFKAMGDAQAQWQPYPAKLKVGTQVQGFVGDGDTYTFRAANPKNLFFRGSLACLKGQLAAAPTTVTPVKSVKDAQVSSIDDSGIFFGLVAWKNELILGATNDAFADEIITIQNYGVNVGYSMQFGRTPSWNYGMQTQITGAFSFLKNKDATPTTRFTGKGMVAAFHLRPYLYYQLGSGFGVGPLTALSIQYGVFGKTTDGEITKPLTIGFVSGASFKISSAGHTIDLGVLNFDPARWYTAVNFMF